jgi:VWFA-related protein
MLSGCRNRVRSRGGALVLIAVILAAHTPAAQQPASGAGTAQQPPVFRSGTNLVLVDVVVRDRTGAIVRGLTADDFQLLEDGQPQQIQSFAFEQIGAQGQPMTTAGLLSSINGGSGPVRVLDAAQPDAAPSTAPLGTTDLAGHRLIVIVFDTSSMQPEDVQSAIDAADTWVKDRMTDADLVAVATIGSALSVLTDFTTDKSVVQTALNRLSAADGIAPDAIDASTASTDAASTNATDDSVAVDAGTQELDTFNNDVRLRALTTLAEALTPLQQKKAILYFSSGMSRNGTDNQVELRKAVNAAVRANIAIYPADARGLQAVVPGGSARNRSQGGLGAFSGSAVANQFTQLAAQQETLQTLASDTGGTAFTDTNDFGEAFARITRDISAYYILGFSSTNGARDGRFRRITVKLRARAGLKVEAREGYYADRDFAHTAKGDREVLLREQLAAALPATDIPVYMTAGWFRVSADRYFVPLSVAVPGSAIPASASRAALDIAGAIRDERGLPVAQIRDTLNVPPNATGATTSRQVLYETGVSLPPGRFTAKVVVRENTDGLMGTFEAPIVVPDLKRAPVKVSSVVVSTQLQPAAPRKTANPLVRDNTELVPNLTHIVSRDQQIYLYYEVYDPSQAGGMPQLATSLAFYHAGVKVFETPVVEKTSLDAADRRAAIFQFEVPPGSLKPGLYDCQINIVDEAASQFAFPRLQLFVR